MERVFPSTKKINIEKVLTKWLEDSKHHLKYGVFIHSMIFRISLTIKKEDNWLT